MLRLFSLIVFLMTAVIGWSGSIEVYTLGDIHEYTANPQFRHHIRDQIAIVQAAGDPSRRMVLLAGDLITHLYQTGPKSKTNIPAELTDPKTGKAYTYSAGDLEKVRAYDAWFIELLGTMKPDAATIGNHDFDRGLDYFVDLCRKNGIQPIAANYPGLPPYLLLPKQDSEGRKHLIGVVGLCGFEHVYPEKVDMPRPAKSLFIQAAKDARAHGASVVILLSHEPDACDLELGHDKEFCAVFDLIVAAHSHVIMPEAGKKVETVFTAGRPTTITVLKAGCHGSNMGRATLEFGPEDKLTRLQAWNW